jgi:hypothetical protein
MDNYAAHKTADIRDWLAKNPHIHVHFTPTSASWMNLVGVWFSVIGRQAIHRGTFTSAKASHQDQAVHHRLEQPLPPFVRTKPPTRSQEGQPSEHFKHTPLVSCF